jgi:hypothetical protein
MTEIKGVCRDCHFRAQEWTLAENPDGTHELVLDKLCRISENFVPPEGYCHCWEAI